RRQLDALVSVAFLILQVRLDGQHADVTLVRSAGPEHPPDGWRVVFKIRLENLQPVFAGQVINFMRHRAFVPGICCQTAKSLDQLLEKLFFVLVQFSVLPANDKVVPERCHLRQPHADVKGHLIFQALMNAARSIGAEASPFFKLATDLSSIFRERAETAWGDTSTRGSSRKQPFESARPFP